MVEDLFQWLIDPSLDYIRHECKLLIQTSGIHLVYTMLRLFHNLLDEIIEAGKKRGSDEDMTVPAMSASQITLWLQGLFLFSLVWTVGGTLTGDSRKKFDVYFRNLISGMDNDHPKPKTIKLNKVQYTYIVHMHRAAFLTSC